MVKKQRSLLQHVTYKEPYIRSINSNPARPTSYSKGMNTGEKMIFWVMKGEISFLAIWRIISDFRGKRGNPKTLRSYTLL